MAEVGRAAGAGAGDVVRAAVQPLASIATSARAAPTLSMPLSSSNGAAIACYAEATVSDAEIVPSPLRRRLENDPWARTLGIDFLDIRRGHSRLRLQLRSHMVNFQGYPHGGGIFSLAPCLTALAIKRASAHIQTGRRRP